MLKRFSDFVNLNLEKYSSDINSDSILENNSFDVIFALIFYHHIELTVKAATDNTEQRADRSIFTGDLFMIGEDIG